LPNIVRRTISDPESGEVREYFLGTVRSDLAKSLTFVPVKEESRRTYLVEETTEGYQRPGSAVRMKAFATFVREHPLSVVPPVVLSGRDAWKFSGKGDHGEIEVYGPAAIVDGQHRVGGYVFLYESENFLRNVDFILLVGLERDDEIAEFLSINETQKGVPKSLNVLLGGSDEAMLGVALDEDEGSPLKGRIAQVTKTKEQLFTLAAVAKNIGRTFAHGAFESANTDAKLEVLIRYWDLISEIFPDEWEDVSRRPQDTKMLETTGLIAWSLAAEDILGPAFDPDTQTVNWDMVRAKIEKLAVPGALDWRKDGEFQGLTGEVGGAKIHRKIQQILAVGAIADEENEEEAEPF
jgi:DNA sulfur modification protein DndB